MKRIMAILVMMGVMTGCGATAMRLVKSPEDQAYIDRASAVPLTFKMSKNKADEAWGRAQSFIGRYSSMKIQTASDYVIQTFNPGEYSGYGYNVTRSVIGDECEVTVECNAGNVWSGKNATLNAHILALYIKTGELKPQFISQGV